ncbi:adenosylmethionine-8-amino-7-oxononanoate aminotransferase [Rhizodiscina lignyota]|uniref:Adenosylmethionine-8-amino-7-oxononanoate aminotransferase n=1 Tax=Rhizodiscina lignyota TaxID=1504668 RepID=A0A9P4IHG6_9PEZI|nr:adenosylmethionine-8-amino-7-oxononanoate aminotransferase [Rhizodiscina lignyota]
MQRIGSALWPSLQCFQVYGANTNVGKTIVSTALCKAWRGKLDLSVHYLKPVSTGPLDDADVNHMAKFAPGVNTKTLFQFSKPLSPHIAAKDAGDIPPDLTVQQRTYHDLSEAVTKADVAIVETAGGVLSPAPSGSVQADVYRPLRLPVLLVGDYHLGGISSTIAAYESLRIRGYDVLAHFIFEDAEYQNSKYLTDFFLGNKVSTIELPKPPRQVEDAMKDLQNMQTYYSDVAASHAILEAVERLGHQHEARIKRLGEMSARAADTIWYPFTQHKGRRPEDIVVIDSAFGDNFDTLSNTMSPEASILTPAMDGSASWWTQGLGHGNPSLALSAASAAGRYGHVMFAGAIHEPALSLAEMLLQHHDNPRLAKVFYSDNGSTGMEVAVKMALRAARTRYGWDHAQEDIGILGLRGSYHGDTMGVMDCSEPSTYNDRIEWYNPKGYWLDYPTVIMRAGRWFVEPPHGQEAAFGNAQSFDSLNDIFDLRRREDAVYTRYIEKTLTELRDAGRKFGALILEPVILGAGGMNFIDPLFQHALIKAVRNRPDLIGTQKLRKPGSLDSWSGLPVVFDEVFTGLYRLGRFNCSSFLQAQPDIVVNAKLLTGGLIPLCTTTASQDIFDAFLSDEKADALLHGHSYTAHAVGCAVAVDSLDAMMQMEKTGKWDEFRRSWATDEVTGEGCWSMWSKEFVTKVTNKESIDGVFAIGSVLALTLKDAAGGGYNSLAAQGLHSRLLDIGDKGWRIHSRVLGNVLYLMTSQITTWETLKNVEQFILESVN